jgi:hypothetical protein
MNVFLIFEMVPDSTDMYFIPNVSDSDLKLLDAANGKYLNSDCKTDEVRKVCDFLSEDPEYCTDPEDKENCKWSEFKMADCKEKAVWEYDGFNLIQRIYITGFVM